MAHVTARHAPAPSQTFYSQLSFSAGRQRGAEGRIDSPFGSVDWTYATTYQAFGLSGTADPNM
jgi:hypothetical protein